MSLYKRRVAAGLCGSCGKGPPVLGNKQCESCGEKSKARTAGRREATTAAGLCLSGCGQPAERDKTRCAACAAKQVKDQQQRVDARKEAGLCANCGKCPPKAGCVQCQPCIDQKGSTSMQHYERRKAAGLCFYCNETPELGSTVCAHHRAYAADYRWRIKLEALEAYGGCVCIGCGNSEAEILEIDHIAGGGCQHRRAVNCGGGGHSFYLWLKRNGYPAGFRVLCPTCNKKAHRRIPLPDAAVLAEQPQ